MSASVCTINPPGHDWENGLTCRWCHATRTVAEAILSQLSSRRGGTPADAQKLLDAYRAEVLAEAPAVPAGPTGRVARLLDAIRTGRGRWTTTRAAQFYRDARLEPPGAQWSRTRTVARGDLHDLAAWGHLIRHEEPGRTYFVLKTRKGGA